jgi:replicative DNA helicase
MVAFIYRPEYYNITQDEQGQPLEGTAEIILAKHRNGSLGTVKLKFISKLARFSDLDGNAYFDDSYVTETADSSNSIIRESRMNNMEDDAPF